MVERQLVFVNKLIRKLPVIRYLKFSFYKFELLEGLNYAANTVPL